MKTNPPNQEDISQRAREIWSAQGSPAGRDAEIWFEAERQLSGQTSDSPARQHGRGGQESQGATATEQRVKADAASESAVENLISPPVSENEAVKAAVQKNAVAVPQTPGPRADRSAPR